MSVQLFKDGDHMAIQTDCKDEREFMDEFNELLSNLIDENRYEGDWEFQLRFWLPSVVDICCAYRGYKADVDRKTVLVSGDRLVGQRPAHEYNPRKEVAESPLE